MMSRACLLVLIYHVLTGITAPTTYDQRQTGDVNVHVYWKDLQIVALLDKDLLDDYPALDYFYDSDPLAIPEHGLLPYGESLASNDHSTVEDPSKPSALNSTVEDPSEPSALNSTVEDSSESSALNSTVEDSSESSALNSTVEDSSESSALNSTVEDSSESSALNSTVEDSSESSALNSTVEDSSESSALNSTVEDSSKISTVNTEGPTEAAIEKTEKPIGENINNNGEQQVGRSRQRYSLRKKKICESRCDENVKGGGPGCCRISNRRLSLVPYAMNLAPKILGSLMRSVKRQPS